MGSPILFWISSFNVGIKRAISLETPLKPFSYLMVTSCVFMISNSTAWTGMEKDNMRDNIKILLAMFLLIILSGTMETIYGPLSSPTNKISIDSKISSCYFNLGKVNSYCAVCNRVMGSQVDIAVAAHINLRINFSIRSPGKRAYQNRGSHHYCYEASPLFPNHIVFHPPLRRFSWREC